MAGDTLNNDDLDALLAEMENDPTLNDSGSEENIEEDTSGEALLDLGSDEELNTDIDSIFDDEEKKEEDEAKEGEKKEEKKEEELDAHPFDPKELKLHEIDETMLVRRRNGERNPHIEVVKKEDVELYQYKDMTDEVIEKKYKTPTGKEQALKRKQEGNNGGGVVAQTSSGIGTNPNKSQEETKVEFDDTKLSKKLNQLGDGLRIGIKQLKEGIDTIKSDVIKNQNLSNDISSNINQVVSSNLNNLKNDMNKMKEELKQNMEQQVSAQVELQEEIKQSLKEILNNKQRDKENLNKMFEDLKDFSFKLIEKVIEKEVSENSSQIIKNTLDNMSKDFERITDITLFLSPKDEDLKEEMEKYLDSLYSGVNNIEIKIDKNLTKGSFFFNTNNGNAQSILTEKIRLIKEFM